MQIAMRCVVLILLLAVVAQPRAAAKGVSTEEANAAELYRAAWERHAELVDLFTAELERTRFRIVTQNWELPEKKTINVLSECRPLVEDLIRASRAGEADWGIDPDGLFVVFPHLAQMRWSARLLAADARARMVLGETDEAAERIAAMFRMSGHLRSDSAAVSALTAIAIFEFASPMAELFVDKAHPTPEYLKTIGTAFAALPDDDPFGMLDAIKGERRRNRSGSADWVELHASPERASPIVDGPLRFAEAFVMMVQLERLDAMYESLIEAWRSDDPIARLAEIKTEIDSGHYGTIAQYYSPMVLSAFRADQRARARIAELNAMLDKHESSQR